MKIVRIVILLGVVVLGVILSLVFSRHNDELIRVVTPTPGALVTSPLVISGEARGNWYFEASFPAELLDANGKQLFIGPIQAHGEWMTEDFVPFNEEITFALSETASGTLVLRKDNPSGLPEHDAEVRVPVYFRNVLYPGGRNVSFGESAILEVGEMVIWGSEMAIQLEEISDSRCKPDVQCVWAGQLAVKITFGELGAEMILGTEHTKSQTALGYTFILVDATETTATLRVVKAL